MNRNRALLVLPFVLWLVVAFTLPIAAWVAGSWMTYVALIVTIVFARQRKSVRPTTWIGLGLGFVLLITAQLLGPQPAGWVALAAGVLVVWTTTVRANQHFHRVHPSWTTGCRAATSGACSNGGVAMTDRDPAAITSKGTFLSLRA